MGGVLRYLGQHFPVLWAEVERKHYNANWRCTLELSARVVVVGACDILQTRGGHATPTNEVDICTHPSASGDASSSTKSMASLFESECS